MSGDDCFGGKAVAPTDALSAIALDELQSSRGALGRLPLRPAKASVSWLRAVLSKVVWSGCGLITG